MRGTLSFRAKLFRSVSANPTLSSRQSLLPRESRRLRCQRREARKTTHLLYCARCRVRTGRTPAEPQALAEAYSPHCSPGKEKSLGADLSEVVAAWPLLAEPLKAAVLAIVRSVSTDRGGLVKRGLRVVGEVGK